MMLSGRVHGVTNLKNGSLLKTVIKKTSALRLTTMESFG